MYSHAPFPPFCVSPVRPLSAADSVLALAARQTSGGTAACAEVSADAYCAKKRPCKNAPQKGSKSHFGAIFSPLGLPWRRRWRGGASFIMLAGVHKYTLREPASAPLTPDAQFTALNGRTGVRLERLCRPHVVECLYIMQLFSSYAFRRNLCSTAMSGNVPPRIIPAFLHLFASPLCAH